VLDPREGGQTPETSNPKCMIDDSKKCPNGRIPATRSEGDELREDYEPECGKPEEETKKCPKGRFPEVRIYTGVSPDATTRTECERTRQFDKIKEKKIKDKDFRKREKKEWNKNEPERREEKEKFRRAWEKIKKAREEFKKKFQETHKKLTEMNDRKKARMGKCAPIAAMMYAFTESLSNQRKREEEESPYDW
jgi:hypothetical protein